MRVALLPKLVGVVLGLAPVKKLQAIAYAAFHCLPPGWTNAGLRSTP
jgi:hypothetical protein